MQFPVNYNLETLDIILDVFPTVLSKIILEYIGNKKLNLTTIKINAFLPAIISNVIYKYMEDKKFDIKKCQCVCRQSLHALVRHSLHPLPPLRGSPAFRYVEAKYGEYFPQIQGKAITSFSKRHEKKKRLAEIRRQESEKTGTTLFPSEIANNEKCFKRWQKCRCCYRHGCL